MKAGGSKTAILDARVLDGCAPIRDGLGLRRFSHHDVDDGDACHEYPEGLRGKCYEKPESDHDRGKRGHARPQDECG